MSHEIILVAISDAIDMSNKHVNLAACMLNNDFVGFFVHARICPVSAHCNWSYIYIVIMIPYLVILLRTLFWSHTCRKIKSLHIFSVLFFHICSMNNYYLHLRCWILLYGMNLLSFICKYVYGAISNFSRIWIYTTVTVLLYS